MRSSRGHSAVRPVGDPDRAVAPATPHKDGAPLDLRLFALQQQAGNAAVASILAGAHPAARPSAGGTVQRAPAGDSPVAAAGPDAGSAMAGQLGALWEGGVVVPLARAADRLGREDKDVAGARTDLAGALQMIRTVRDGTPANDANRFRLVAVERIVKGVLDVVDQRMGGTTSDAQFERELMSLRLEAVELQPIVTHKPPIGDLVGAVLGEGAADFEIPASVAEKSAAALWKIFVVDYLWEAQRDIGQRSPADTWKDVLRVGLLIQHFQRAAPGGDPSGPRLFALEAGATALLSRLHERIPAGDLGSATADDLADDSVRAYELGAAMKRFLTGEPAAAETPPGAADAGEPDFTWENTDPVAPQRTFENDTDLLRPGE